MPRHYAIELRRRFSLQPEFSPDISRGIFRLSFSDSCIFELIEITSDN